MVEDKDFSHYIPAKRLIFNTAVDYTNYIKSGTTFTMIRKERSKSQKECYDVHLIPPIRIRNGLPVMLYFNLTNINQEFLMDKAEEKHLNFYAPDEMIQISVRLDEYDEEPIPIKFLKKSYETSIKLQSLVYPNSTLNLYANFSDDKAGCFITFYVKT